MSEIRILVTGGGRGIGRAIALRFAREGARVVVASRTSNELDSVVGEIEAAGGKGLAAQMNVRDFGSVEAAVYRAVQFTGGALDVVVNNAGVFSIAPFAKMDIETWQRALEVNLSGPFFVAMEALEALEEGDRPHLFNIASRAALQAYPGNTAYCASKYGLRGLSDSLRLDLAENGIRVSTVYPRPTDTSIFDGVPGDWDRAAMDRPEDVAEALWKAYHAPESADVADIEVGEGD